MQSRCPLPSANTCPQKPEPYLNGFESLHRSLNLLRLARHEERAAEAAAQRLQEVHVEIDRAKILLQVDLVVGMHQELADLLPEKPGRLVKHDRNVRRIRLPSEVPAKNGNVPPRIRIELINRLDPRILLIKKKLNLLLARLLVRSAREWRRPPRRRHRHRDPVPETSRSAPQQAEDPDSTADSPACEPAPRPPGKLQALAEPRQTEKKQPGPAVSVRVAHQDLLCAELRRRKNREAVTSWKSDHEGAMDSNSSRMTAPSHQSSKPFRNDRILLKNSPGTLPD